MQHRCRLTLLFAITALVVITVAALIVNKLTGDIAQANLIRVTEESAVPDAAHIQSMMRDSHLMLGISPAQAAVNGDPMQPTPQLMSHQGSPLTLESLVVPEGLPSHLPVMIEGLSIVKFNIFDLDRVAAWSTDPASIGKINHNSSLWPKAVNGNVGSKLERNRTLVNLSGENRTIDIVETYLPLRDTPSGESL